VIHISNFRVVPRGIPRRTRLAQRLVHAANTIAFPLEHERYIACVLHAAPLSANTNVVSVPKIGEFSRVYTTHQSDVIMNLACATFAEFRRWFGFVCWKQKHIACKLNIEVMFYWNIPFFNGNQICLLRFQHPNKPSYSWLWTNITTIGTYSINQFSNNQSISVLT